MSTNSTLLTPEVIQSLPEGIRTLVLAALEAEFQRDPTKAETLAELAPWVNEVLTKRSSRDEKREISDAIAGLLIRQKRLLLDCPTDSPMNAMPYVIADDGTAVPLDGDALQFRAMLQQAGLNATEPVYRWVVADLQARAVNSGRQVKLSRWTVQRDNALYVSCGPRGMIRASNTLEMLRNGDDGVLFASDACLPEWNPSVEPMDPRKLLAFQLPLEAPPEMPAYTPDIQRALLVTWMTARMAGVWPLPILVFIGAKGSGKTTAARAIAKLFLGNGGDVSDAGMDDRSLKVALTCKPIVVLDNLDSEPPKWLPDLLCTTSTGGVVTTRRLYTDRELVESPITAGVIITTRTAAFADRVDLLERILPIFVGELSPTMRSDDSAISTEILTHRDHILTWLVRQAQQGLAAAMESELRTRFLKFSVIAQTLLKKQTFEALDAWNRAQQLCITDPDPLVAAILEFLPAEGLRGSPTDIVRILQERGAELPYLGGAKAIARRLRELSPTLRLAGVSIQEDKDEHRHLILTIWRDMK